MDLSSHFEYKDNTGDTAHSLGKDPLNPSTRRVPGLYNSDQKAKFENFRDGWLKQQQKIHSKTYRKIREGLEDPASKTYYRPEAYYEQIKRYIPLMIKKTLDIYREYMFTLKRLQYIKANPTLASQDEKEKIKVIIQTWGKYLQDYLDFIHDHLGHLIMFDSYDVEDYDSLKAAYFQLVYVYTNLYGKTDQREIRDILEITHPEKLKLDDVYRMKNQRIIIRNMDKMFSGEENDKTFGKLSNKEIEDVLKEVLPKYMDPDKAEQFMEAHENKARILDRILKQTLVPKAALMKELTKKNLDHKINELRNFYKRKPPVRPELVEEMINKIESMYKFLVGSYLVEKPENLKRTKSNIKNIAFKSGPAILRTLEETYMEGSPLYETVETMIKDARFLYDSAQETVNDLKEMKKSSTDFSKNIVFKEVKESSLPMKIKPNALEKLKAHKAIIIEGTIPVEDKVSILDNFKKVYPYKDIKKKIDLVTMFFHKHDNLYENLSVDLIFVVGGLSNLYSYLRDGYNRKPSHAPVQMGPFVPVEGLEGMKAAPFLVSSYDMGD